MPAFMSARVHLSQHLSAVSHFGLHEAKRHRLGPGDCARPRRFAAANDLVGKSD
jgi:hypothetical protein